MTSSAILKFFVIAKLVEFGVFLILNRLNISRITASDKVPPKFTGRVTEESFLKSRAYSITKLSFETLYEAFDLIVLFTFILFGGFTFLENFSQKMFSNEALMGVVFCFTISFGKEILDLPFSLYQTFVIEEKFGFNKMTIGLYFADMAKKFLISLMLGIPIIYFLVWVIKSSGDLWWVYGFLGLSSFQIFLIWIYPTWIAPFFNKFVPMEKGELKDSIFEIANRVNFKLSEIFVMDGSKRSSHSNAYFTGLGKNRRIVLFDTLINMLTRGELINVLSHEMGHNKLKHIQKMLFISLGLTFSGFYLWSLLIHYGPLYQAFGLSGKNLFPALIIFPMIMGPVSFFLAPLFNSFSRKHEFQADAFAAEITGSGADLQNALLKLNEKNLSNLTPHPLYSFFYYSHPTLAERLDALDKKISNK